MSKFFRKLSGMILMVMMITNIVPYMAFADESRNTAGDDVPTVRVYLSISDDSEFITGKDSDSRIMARVPIDVPYVDLAEYGLENYYRYEAKPFEEGGQYINNVIVEQPTLLMCYIRALSLYYLGREFRASDVGTNAMEVSGGATSLYFLHLFGHYYNFMYFVNHEYPLMAKGWGSTADYILLEDGDEIDVGMFTDTRFNQYGGFAYFDSGNEKITAGDSISLSLYMTRSKESTTGSGYNGVMSKEPIRVSSDYGRTWQKNVCATDKQGAFTMPFDEAGVYYVSAGPVFKNQPYTQLQCITPPICVVEVEPSEVVNGQAATADPNSVKVSWNESKGADGYIVAYTSTSGDEKEVTVSEPELTVNDVDTEECSFSVKAFLNDEYVAYGEDPKKLYSNEVIILGGYKGDAIREIADSFDTASYRKAEQTEIEKIMENARSRIESANSREEAEGIVSEIKAEIEKLKTDAEYTEEEKRAEEAERRAEEARKAKEEAERKAKEEAARKAAEEKARQEAEIDAQNKASEKAQDGSGSKTKEETERKAREKKATAHIASAKAVKVKISAKAIKAKGKAKKSKRRRAKISWKKALIKYAANGASYAANVTGYKVYRAAKKNGKYKRVKTVTKAGTTKWTDKKLKKGKKYFYKVRPYTVISGKTYLGKWSNAAAVKTK